MGKVEVSVIAALGEKIESTAQIPLDQIAQLKEVVHENDSTLKDKLKVITTT